MYLTILYIAFVKEGRNFLWERKNPEKTALFKTRYDSVFEELERCKKDIYDEETTKKEGRLGSK